MGVGEAECGTEVGRGVENEKRESKGGVGQRRVKFYLNVRS